jgi:hypothetical protein
MDIDFGEAAPSRHQILRTTRHSVCEPGNRVPVKGGLNETPLVFPVIAFAGQQTFAQQPSEVTQSGIFDEVSGIPNQHVFDVLGVIQKVHVLPQRPIIKDIAEFTGPVAV